MFLRGEKEVYLILQIKKSIYNVAKRMLNLTGEIDIKVNRVRGKKNLVNFSAKSIAATNWS